MTKNVLLASILMLLSACSSNNSTSQNPMTSEKKSPCLFSKDSKKGISLSDILNQKDSSGNNVNVNGVVTKKNSFSVCAKAGWSFSHLPDECSLCATLFSWLFSLERSRCLCSI